VSCFVKIRRILDRSKSLFLFVYVYVNVCNLVCCERGIINRDRLIRLSLDDLIGVSAAIFFILS